MQGYYIKLLERGEEYLIRGLLLVDEGLKMSPFKILFENNIIIKI